MKCLEAPVAPFQIHEHYGHKLVIDTCSFDGHMAQHKKFKKHFLMGVGWKQMTGFMPLTTKCRLSKPMCIVLC